MSQFCRSSIVTARKHHTCVHCRCEIAPGTTYQKMFVVDGGDAWSYKEHTDCAALASELAEEYNLLPGDEWPWLCDEDADEIAAYRGFYPHVVCRLERSQQLRLIRAGVSAEEAAA